MFRDLVRVGALGEEVRLEKRGGVLDVCAELEAATGSSWSSSIKEMRRLFRGRSVEVLLFVLWYRLAFWFIVGGDANARHTIDQT